MKIETLKSRKKKYFLYVLIVGVVLLLPLVLSITFGKYQTKESIKLAEGSITYKPYDFKIMAMYQKNENSEYEEIETMPTSGYIINEEKSYCTIDNINKDSKVVLKTMNGNHIVSNLNKNEKCYIWFDKVSTIQNIIEIHNLAIRNDFSTTLTTDTTGTLFMAPDDYGTSYYYAGAVQDNWVKFAGFYWRIIRINGDGTLRMIYSGTDSTIGIESTINNGAGYYFSTSEGKIDNTMYAGYMYASGEIHGLSTSCYVKQQIDVWFENNLNKLEIINQIDGDVGFCGDRTPSTNSSFSNGIGGTGTTTTYYGAFIRLVSNKIPNLKCINNLDLYTINNSNNGNKALKYPIGLITADEVAYAGGVFEINNLNYYLYVGSDYWTLSPYGFSLGYAHPTHIMAVRHKGNLYSIPVDNNARIRPVINLKAETTFSSGDGTASNPYIVS